MGRFGAGLWGLLVERGSGGAGELATSLGLLDPSAQWVQAQLAGHDLAFAKEAPISRSSRMFQRWRLHRLRRPVPSSGVDL